MISRHRIGGTWDNEPLRPREFLRRYSLPQLVRVYESATHRVQSPSKLDLTQPFLLYKAYSCRKLHAHSLDTNGHGGLRPVGPPLVIPENYTGWFAVISDDGHTAGYFSTIEQVARAQVPVFLVRDDISCYQLPDKEEGKGIYTKTTVRAGQALRFLGVYDDVIQRSKKTLLNNRRRHSDNKGRYAKCLTEKGSIIYVPFTTTGRFYAVARRPSLSINHVFPITHLVQACRLPSTVQLLVGPQPTLQCQFTGVLRVETVHVQEVILACTVRDHETLLLEFDLESNFSFVRTPLGSSSKMPDAFLKRLSYCKFQADNWIRQIKVAQHVVPQTPIESRRTPSFGRIRGGKKGTLDKPPLLPSLFISGNYADLGSNPCGSTVKSKSSTGSRASSTSSRVSRALQRLWKRSKKIQLESADDSDSKESCGPPMGSLSTVSYSTMDFHFYEPLRTDVKPKAFVDHTYHNNKKLMTKGVFRIPGFQIDEDGYVTSRADDDDDESIYSSIC